MQQDTIRTQTFKLNLNMDRVNMKHSGTGDIIRGDKITYSERLKSERESIPLWLKWVATISGIFGVAWTFYISF